jgi:plasmid stabilization system protein ParE
MKVRYLVEAGNDLEDIHSYYTNVESDEFANKIVDELLDVIDSLEEFEHRGNYIKEFLKLDSKKYRELHHMVFRVIYTIFDDAVLIVAVLDGRRDILPILQQRKLS